MVMKLFKTKWGKWMDISTGAINEHRYLLQARRHDNGRVSFRIEHVDNAWGCAVPTLEQLKDVKGGRNVAQ